MSDLTEVIVAASNSEPIPGVPATNGKPSRPDPDAYRTELQARLAEAEKELTKDQRSLEAARAKVADLVAYVEFDEMRVGSRTKEIAEFDRLWKKAAK